MSRKTLEAYDRLVDAAGKDAATAYRQLLTGWLRLNPSATANEIIDQAADFACTVLDVYGPASTIAADELARELAAQEGRSGRTDTYYEPDRDHMAEILGSEKSRSPLLRGDISDFIEQSSKRVRDECHRAANKQMLKSGQALGCKTYARVPVGDSKTCEFCVKVASRGFMSPDKRNKGDLERLHDNCRCKVVAGFGKDPSVEGYDPDEWLDAYHEQRELRNKGYSHGQIQRAMEGVPLGELGEPNSGVGGRPRKQVTATELPRIRDKYVVSYPSGMEKYGDPIKPHVYDFDNFRNHKSEWRDVFAHDMLSLAGYDVIARAPDAPDGFSNIDILANGELWEVKSPEDKDGGQKCKPGNEYKFISNAIDTAYKQFKHQYNPDTGGTLQWDGPVRLVINSKYKPLDDQKMLERVVDDLKKKKSKFEVVFIAKDGSATLVKN